MSKIKITLFITFLITSLNIHSAFADDWVYITRQNDTLQSLCLKYTDKPNCPSIIRQSQVAVNATSDLPIGLVIKFPVDWLKEVPQLVLVQFVHGDVRYTTRKEGSERALTKGVILPVGAKIITGKGNCSLRFTDGTVLLVGEQSEIVLASLSDSKKSEPAYSTIHLKKGTTKSKVPVKKIKSHFEIKTPAAVAAVRGTEFRVAYSQQNDNVAQHVMRGEVLKGIVDVGNHKNSQEVLAGYAVTAEKGKRLKAPRPLLKAPILVTNNIAQTSPVKAEWQSVKGAKSYHCELYNDNDNEELIMVDRTTKPQCQYSQLSEQCYRFKVRAIDKDNIEGYNANQKFCIEATLGIPVLEKEKLIYDVSQQALMASWSPVDRASSYTVEIASDSEFNTVIARQDTSSVSASIPLSNTLKHVYVRVNAMSKLGQQGEFSKPEEWESNYLSAFIKFMSTVIAGIVIL